MEDISHAHIVSFMYKLITSAKDTDDLFFDFDCDGVRIQRELSNNKRIKGKYENKLSFTLFVLTIGTLRFDEKPFL